MLRNHGLLTVGPTVADAFLAMYTFETTCQIQISAQTGGELMQVNPRIMETMPMVIEMVTKGQGSSIAWPALLRKLDRTDASFRS
jgi:ribulose-5-phosphate 4-epimerase/fuculose-1-phosphate aldolase